MARLYESRLQANAGMFGWQRQKGGSWGGWGMAPTCKGMLGMHKGFDHKGFASKGSVWDGFAPGSFRSGWLGDNMPSGSFKGAGGKGKAIDPAALADTIGGSDKIFVGGLPQNCAAEALSEYFSKYGHISHAEVKTDVATGRTRGFGFIQFDGAEAVERAVADYNTHVIEGKWIEVKRAVPQGVVSSTGSAGVAVLPAQATIPAAQAIVPGMAALPKSGQQESDKIFVGGLPQNSTVEALSEYFRKFGIVVGAEVKTDRLTGRTRGFGFVQFDCAEAVDRVLGAYASHVMDGKWIEVKRAVAQPRPFSTLAAAAGGANVTSGAYAAGGAHLAAGAYAAVGHIAGEYVGLRRGSGAQVGPY